MQFNINREIIEKENFDIVVVGGGVAGAAAALASARNGKSVLLIEKSVLLGGLATIGLISWYEPLCNHKGKKLIGGIAEELLLLSIKYGYDNLPDCWKNGGWEATEERKYATLFSPTIFALALSDLLQSNGVTLRLDTLATYPVMERKVCKGVIVESKSGTEFFGAKIVIDSSGDADLFSRAGVPCEIGENYLSYVAQVAEFGEDKEPFNTFKLRRWKSCGSDLWGNGHPVEMKHFTGVTGDEVTEFVLEGQKRLFDQIKVQDKHTREITTLPTMAQFRKTRHICGEYTLTAKDLYQHHDDSIGRIGDFRNSGHWYEVPYGTLYSRKVDNMLAAGRIISASDEGWEVTRVIPVAAFTGEVAGEAASLSLNTGNNVSDIDLRTLQKTLQNKGIRLHVEDE